MLNDIFLEVARKHKIPVDQVELVYKSFTDTLRYYMTNPLYSKTKLLIAGFGSFKITKRSAEQSEDENYKIYQRIYERKKRRKPTND